MARPLARRVALVSGASRGIGKGIALELGEAGVTVYVTGRTRPAVAATADAVTRLGGKGISAPCDHRREDEVRAVFRRIEAEHGRLDLCVNNLLPSEGLGRQPFWELPQSAWDEHAATLRAQYLTTRLAAPIMIARGGGLILFVSSSGAARFFSNVADHAMQAAVDKLAADMADELRVHGVTVVSLWPGLTKTERVLGQPERYDLGAAGTPQFTGRAVVSLAADPDVSAKTGRALPVLDLAHEYGFTDVDGTLPDW